MKIRKNLNAIVLQDWFVRFRDSENVYLPPELNAKILSGKVYGHHKFQDGDSVNTSKIVGVNGRRIRTEGGSTYLLGSIQKEYLAWLKKEGLGYNPRLPVSIKERKGF